MVRHHSTLFSVESVQLQRFPHNSIQFSYLTNLGNLRIFEIANLSFLRIFCAIYFFLKIAFNIVLPILRSSPCLLKGIPVSRAIFCFACVIPNALFQEKERPGIGVDFFAILIVKAISAIRAFIAMYIATASMF